MHERTIERPKSARRRPQSSRKLTPAQIRALGEKYYAGSNVQTIMAEYQIARSSLYRYLAEYNAQPEVNHDPTHWRIECERLKNLVVELALENKRLKTVVHSEVSLARS